MPPGISNVPKEFYIGHKNPKQREGNELTAHSHLAGKKIKKLGYSILKDNLLPALVPAFHIYFSTAVLQMTCRNSTVRTHCDDFNSSCGQCNVNAADICHHIKASKLPVTS